MLINDIFPNEHAHKWNGWHTYLEQSVEVLMAYGTLTPHLLGRPAAALALTVVPLERFLRQLHTDWRSAPVDAIEFRLLTPLQHCAGGLPWPVRAYDMHWARADATWPHEIAAFVVCGPVRRRMVMVTAAIARISKLAMILLLLWGNNDLKFLN